MTAAYPLRTPPEKLAALEIIRLAHPGVTCIAQCEHIDTHWRTIVTESGDKHRVGLYAMAGGAKSMGLPG